jgi:hypothetical protein
MAKTQKTIKILWAAAAGFCAFPHCEERLCSPDIREFASFTIGEMAHICGEKPEANRYDSNQTPTQRDDYSNLILLCPNHHTLVDKKENEQVYSVSILKKMKTAHEEFVLNRLEKITPQNKQDVSQQIAILLAENHEVWLQFGPFSEIATKNPHSESAHAIWMSERFSRIVPNNRLITKMLESNRGFFPAEEQKQISSFLAHARSYERWVQDEMTYEAVSRFPKEFDDMIKKYANAT